MHSFHLAEIVTRDKIIHQGIFYKPEKSSQTALLWIHGLTSTFYSNVKLLNAFGEECKKYSFGFASFNNRGHDIVTGLKKVDPQSEKGYTRVDGGASVENFADSVYDIEAGIKFLVEQGFSKIILIGHSTGANKACYFAGKEKNSHVTGIILASPVSDRLDPSLDKKRLMKQIKTMNQLIKTEKANELQFGFHVFPMTPKRYLSAFAAKSLEDQFDYGDPSPKLTHFQKIKQPLLVLFSEHDEYFDRPVEKVKKVFDTYAKSKKYSSIILKKALHSFNGTENLAVQTIINWVRSI